MKFASIGFGGMGRAIHDVALEQGHECVAQIDANDPWDLESADIVFEATLPHVALKNFEKLCAAKKDFVVATTAWHDHLPVVQKMVEEAGVRMIWSQNFSIGVSLFLRIVEASAKMVNQVEYYDIWATEIHHKNKVDSPSGTAKDLESILLKNIDRKTAVVEESLQRKIEDHELHFSSTRGGLVNFGHTIGLDSAADCIKIEHAARNRDGYALGAVKAGEWLKTKPPGFYGMEDFLGEIFKR